MSEFIGVLDLGSVSDFGVFMGRELRLLGCSVIILGENADDAVVHCETTGAFGVLTVEVDAG